MFSQDHHLPALNRFARTIWGNPQAILKRHSEGFEFIDLSDYFEAFQPFLGGALTHDKVLVRNEYHEALKALEDEKYYNGAYVLGHPGIGKTLFIIYVLVTRLGRRQAVAVQYGEEFYALFTDTVAFHSLGFARPLFQNAFVWAFSDSNTLEGSKGPDGIFRGKHDHVRIVQIAPPKASHWKGWSKHHSAKCYVMDIWSEEEVAHLATLFGLDVHRMMTLARMWGNVPRTLVQCNRRTDQEIEDLYLREAVNAVRDCDVLGGRLHDFREDSPLRPLFYFLRPGKTPTGDIHRGRPSQIYVPTRNLRCILAQALQGQSNAVKLQFYRSLGSEAETRQTAMFAYQSWFHNFLAAQHHHIRCQWLKHGSKGRGAARLPTTLSGTTRTVFTPTAWDTPLTQTPPFYWITPSRSFPGIESALVLDSGIFAFQVIVGSNHPHHRSPLEGVQMLRNLLPDKLQNRPWSVVFIQAKDGVAKYVADRWAGQLSFPRKRTRIQVGWSVVDPVQDSVTFKSYHDEDDPV